MMWPEGISTGRSWQEFLRGKIHKVIKLSYE
jgi:hypothetical protein